MKSEVLADCGPLYAAVDPDDAYHPQAQRELKRLARNHLDVIIAYPTRLEALCRKRTIPGYPLV